jgi:hypothetical protein
MFVARLRFALVLTSTVISVGVARADFRCEPTCYPGAPQRPPCDGARIVCEGSGNKAVLAANLIAYRLMEAIIARQGQDSKACRAAVQAAHNTRLAIAQLRDELRRTGDLGSAAGYMVAQGKLLDERELMLSLERGDGEVTLFRACGGGTLLDAPEEAVKLLRSATQLARATTRAQASPRSSSRSSGCVATGEACVSDADCCQGEQRQCISGLCGQDIAPEEEARLDALYDSFAAKIAGMLRQSAQKTYRSQTGVTIELATVMAPPAFAAMGAEIRRHGFTVDRLAAIAKRNPGLAMREANRYVQAITPAAQRFSSSMRTLPPVDAQDCTQLVRFIVTARESLGPDRNLAQNLSPSLKSCTTVLPSHTTRCLDASTIAEFDACDKHGAGDSH